MQRRRRDWQLFWLVVFGLGFWLVIWQHDTLAELYRKSPIPGALNWIESAGSPREK